jgi:hypothetical protein
MKVSMLTHSALKQLYETFTDSEFRRLKKAKGGRTWREWLLRMAEEGTSS